MKKDVERNTTPIAANTTASSALSCCARFSAR
jgi:hypothetical protein